MSMQTRWSSEEFFAAPDRRARLAIHAPPVAQTPHPGVELSSKNKNASRKSIPSGVWATENSLCGGFRFLCQRS
jgi:hypothetical protein